MQYVFIKEKMNMAICPYCKQNISLNDVKKENKGTGFIGQETMYYCPHCNYILGFSNRQR